MTPQPPPYPAEERALIGFCRRSLGTSALPDEPGPIDWDRFLDLSRIHHASSLVWRAASSAAPGVVPGHVLKRLRTIHERTALIALKQAAHLAAIVTGFRDAGILVVPLKGVTLALRSYGSLAMRAASDIDILISPADAARADRLLRASGHTRISCTTHLPLDDASEENASFVYHHSYLSPDGLNVEVHTRLHPNENLLAFSPAKLLEKCDTVAIGDAEIPALDEESQFFFLATHGARHEWEKLLWIYDIAQIANAAGEHRLERWLAAARMRGIENPCLQALVVAHRVLCAPLPASVEAAYRRSPLLQFLVRQAERTLFSGRKVSERPFGMNLRLRLYRFGMMHKRTYVWREVTRGLKAGAVRLKSRWALAR